MRGRILAIDVGEARVGLAISDELQIIASPLGFVSREDSFQEIDSIIKKEGISVILVGMPLLASGEMGSQTKDIQKFAKELKQTTDLNIDFENEILSSVEAENRLKEMKKPYQKGDIDAMAACIILETYLRGV
ncbi:MAG: Holliday junction resolvase RuvX [bacterium]